MKIARTFIVTILPCLIGVLMAIMAWIAAIALCVKAARALGWLP